MTKRIPRLNSLLKEVISAVIKKQVRNPHVAELSSITEVDISKDLSHAKVHVSVMGNEAQRSETIAALESASGFIGVQAAKEVRMHHFPTLTFHLDTSVDKQMKIEGLLKKIEEEKAARDSHG